jgi:hypothetical protein
MARWTCRRDGKSCYYKVDSEDAGGLSDGVTIPVKTFTTR